MGSAGADWKLSIIGPSGSGGKVRGEIAERRTKEPTLNQTWMLINTRSGDCRLEYYLVWGGGGWGTVGGVRYSTDGQHIRTASLTKTSLEEGNLG